MVTALLVGLVVGFVLAMPPGPIAVACIRQALAGQARYALALAIGASAMDIVYALLAAGASSALLVSLGAMVTDNAWSLLALQVGCIVVLAVLGLHYVRTTTHRVDARAWQEKAQEERARPHGLSSPYLIGVLIALTNLASPTFLPSLIFVMGFVHARGWVGHDMGENALYAVGFGAGAALWFGLLLWALSALRAKLSPQVLPMLSRVAGGALLLCAVMLTYHIVTATDWSRLPGWSLTRGSQRGSATDAHRVM
jgi:threonine/homoserine/homoserine lactone efflux protein